MSYAEITVSQLEDNGSASIQTGPFGTQLKASDYTDKGVPVINVRNIGYGDLRREKLEFVPDWIADRLSVHVLAESDIVFGRKGAVDRHLFVSDVQSGWVQGSDCIRLRLSKDRINPRFVSYAFLRSYHKEWMLRQCGNKATMASLNQDVLRRIVLPFPQLEQQRNIVSILSAYDGLIENNRRRIALLEEAARLLYREWFVHFRFPGHEHVDVADGIPEGWERIALSELADFVNGYAFKPTDLFDTGLPIVKIPELRQGVTEKTPRNGGERIPEKYHLKDGDLLFSWSGTLAVNVWAGGPALLNQHLFHVIPTGRVGHGFLMCAIREALAAFDSQTIGATMKHIRRSALDQVLVLLGNPALTAPVEENLNNIYAQLVVLHRQNQKLAQARDLLLPRLMNGQIAV